MPNVVQRASKFVDDVLENCSGKSHSLSIETIVAICMSLQETIIKLQNEVHVHNERESEGNDTSTHDGFASNDD